MKVMKSIFILLAVLGLNLSVLAQQNNQGGNQQANESVEKIDELLKGELVPEDDDKNLTEEQKRRKKAIQEQEALWKNPDSKGYDKNFQELHQLSKAFANNKFRLALSNYQSGVNTILKMREAIEQYRKEEAEKKRLDEKWYWQKVDRKAREDRVVSRDKLVAKQQALNYFTKAINHLDEIKNPDLRERPEFKRLLSDTYRSWILTEYDLQNLPQCIPILELYIEIDENEKEYPAHKYLASCYAFEENMIKKNGGASEDQMFKYRYKKNVHLLRATELKYGKDSPEYKHIVNLVNKDEVISVRP
ncbi:flagellar coiling protein FcpA [Leptospira interrogans]|uniref:flagellar coiling protein FcpA n=1 Tax=Leptospira interrogans TaxID=173 RepID=UPI003CF58180